MRLRQIITTQKAYSRSSKAKTLFLDTTALTAFSNMAPDAQKENKMIYNHLGNTGVRVCLLSAACMLPPRLHYCMRCCRVRMQFASFASDYYDTHVDSARSCHVLPQVWQNCLRRLCIVIGQCLVLWRVGDIRNPS